MKPKIFKLIPLFFFSLLLYIPAAHSQFYLGVQGGALMTNLEGDVNIIWPGTYPGTLQQEVKGAGSGANYKYGYSGGIVLGLRLNDFVSIQPELNSSLKGFNQKYTTVTQAVFPDTAVMTKTEWDNTLDLMYGEVPILLKLSFSIGNGIFPYRPKKGPVDVEVFAGPYVAYRYGSAKSFSATTTITGYGSDTATSTYSGSSSNGDFRLGGGFDPEDTVGISQYFSSFPVRPLFDAGLSVLDVGVTAGVGISIEVGDRGKLFVNGRYSKGFFTIDDGYFTDVVIKVDQEKLNDSDPEKKAQAISVTNVEKDITNVAFGVYFGYTYTFGK